MWKEDDKAFKNIKEKEYKCQKSIVPKHLKK